MADVYMKSKFYFKRGSSQAWSEQNLILGPGEPGFRYWKIKSRQWYNALE